MICIYCFMLSLDMLNFILEIFSLILLLMQKILSNIQGSGSELKYKGEMKDGKLVTATESNIDSIQSWVKESNTIINIEQLLDYFKEKNINKVNINQNL